MPDQPTDSDLDVIRRGIPPGETWDLASLNWLDACCRQAPLLLARAEAAEAAQKQMQDNSTWLSCDCEAYQWLIDDGWTPPPGGCKATPGQRRQEYQRRAEAAEANAANLKTVIEKNTQTIVELTAERDRLQKAILAFGNNPAGDGAT